MATTLTDAGEITYASFPIDKMETNEDGDLIVYGKATDGSVDSDLQIVDPKFASKAIARWKETGANIRVQHNPQRDPAGIGIDVSHDGDATWVKSLVFEPVAKKLVSKGALTAYSVGISRPTIERDVTGKARGGIITNGEIVEISLVDRPANKSCGIQLVKSEGDHLAVVNEVFGDQEVIAKMIGMDVTEKSHKDMGALDGFTAIQPEDLTVSFTPNDLARLLQNKFVEQHFSSLALKAVFDAEAEVYKRDVSTAERRTLASAGHALPDGSYPIANASDLHNAAHLASTGHGNAEAAKKLIARRAKELGVSNPLSDNSDSEKENLSVTDAVTAEVVKTDDVIKEAEPVITKDPDGDKAATPPKKGKKGKAGKKLPPWMQGDDKDDDDASKGDAPQVCKSFLDHVWVGTDAAGADDVQCSKCHTSPAAAAGVVQDMDPAPVGELLTTPAKDHMKGATPQSASGASDSPAMQPVPAHREPDGAAVEAFEKDAKMTDGDEEKPTRMEDMMKASPETSALLRFKTIGIDTDLGRLHDMTCPAFDPEDVHKYHPFSDFSTLINEEVWQRKAVEAAAGRPIGEAMAMQKVWQAAQLLKNFDPAVLNDFRVEAHKAFRDANPGPSSYPTPGSMSPKRFCRPVLTDGRASLSAAYGSPNTSPVVASSSPNAHSFDRPPLSAGHQSPSPSFMKGGFEYPAEQGVPQQLRYESLEKENARRALSMLHDHLNHMFPSACPMLDQDAYRQPESRPVPAPAGIGKGQDAADALKEAAATGSAVPFDGGVALPPGSKVTPEAAFKATPEDGDMFADADVYKAFKKRMKKLGKKVLSGKITVDEARAQLGRRFTQKGDGEPQETVQKAAVAPVVSPVTSTIPGAEVVYRAAAPAAPPVAAFDPEVIKSAVAEAVSPLMERLEKQDKAIADERETFANKLAEQQRVIDAIADQPDPGTAAFSGLAFQPGVMKSRRPAAVPDQAEYAARAQDMIRRNLQHTYQTHSNPHVREAAGSALANLGVTEVAS